MAKPRAGGAIVDVTGRLAHLYKQAPGAFVTNRNALARDLVQAGQRDLASRIKTLTRPSASAWLVNQLYWHERAEYDALLAAGVAAREAQQARLDGAGGGDLERALAERDAVVRRMLQQAERLAAAGGVSLSADTRGRVRTSLEAIALRAGDTSLQHGQLTEDVALPGLQALAGLVARAQDRPAPRRPLTLVPDTDARGRAQQRAALEAEQASVQAELDAIAAASAEAAAEVEAADGALDAARLQVATAERALTAARERLTQSKELEATARTRAEEASERLATAEEGAEELRARQQEIDERLRALTAPTPRGSKKR